MLRTLGELFLDTQKPLRKKKPLLLLSYLLLEGPRSRRHLTELFWPGASDALNSLSVALSQLRAAGVCVEGEEVLRAEAACDAKELESLLKEGRLQEARGLYRGRFLEGADDGLSPELEEWVWSRREAIALALWRAYLERAEALYGLGWEEEALALLQEARALPGVEEVLEAEPELKRFDLEVQRAFFAVQLVGLSRAVELLGLGAETLDFLIRRRLLDSQGQPRLTVAPTIEGRRVALELARKLPLAEAAPLYRLARAHWEEADFSRGRSALLRLARAQVEEQPKEALALLAELAPDPELSLLRARALERLGRYREALDLLDELPDSPDKSALRAGVLFRLGQFAEAQAEAERAKAGGAYAQAEALNLQGMMLLGQGRFQEAAEAFSRASVRFLLAGEEVRHLSALGNRAVALVELGQGEEVFTEVLEAIGPREGLRARLYLNLGVIKERQGQPAEAERLYRESLALAERVGNLEAMGRAWNNLGALYHRQGQPAEARAAYQEALRLAKAGQEWVLTAAVLANLAELTGERAGLEEAIALLEEARYTVLAERYRSRLEAFRLR
jgi:tetratricopeptide (TPR) repeat protein